MILIYLFVSFLNESKNLVLNEEKIQKKNTNQENFSNKILDIKYVSKDENGNIYEIYSVSGESSLEDPDILNLFDVKGKISISNSSIVHIHSDNATYNKENYNTHFYKNVILEYENHIVTSDNLFLDFFEKEVKVENNVIYKNEENKLYADIVEINLLTKISKIYMFEEQKKVKAEVKN